MNGTGSVHHSSLKTARRKSWCTKVLSCTLVFALLVPAAAPAFAFEEETAAPVSCIHHPEHTEECGYIEAMEGSPCTHAHDETCGYAEEITPCGHEHDETCGYTPAAEEVPCDLDCSDTDEEGNVIHQEGCAYTPAVEETACGHVHDENCGYAVKVTSDCTHQHDESCGYREAVEGSPCTFACGKCVLGWEWVDEEEMLVWNEDAKLWGLGVPNVSEETPLPREVLAELLPKTVTVRTAADTEEQEQQTVTLSWDYSNLPDGDVKPGSYTITASLEGDYVLTDGAPALAVLLELGGAETYDEARGDYEHRPVTQVPVPNGNVNPTHKFVSEWSYVAPVGTITHTTEHDYSMNVILDLSSCANKNALVTAIKAALPNKIDCNGTFWGGDYSSFTNAGLAYEKDEGNKVYGKVDITWNIDAVVDAYLSAHGSITDGAELQLYADPVSKTGYLIRVNTNDPDYDDNNNGEADTAEAYDILNLKVTLKAIKKAYPGPVEQVPAEAGTTDKYVNDWYYEVPGSGYTITSDANKFGYSAGLAVPLDLPTNDLVKAITNALPSRIYGTGSNANGDLVKAGFIPKNPDPGTATIEGYVELKWNVEEVVKAAGSITDGAKLTFYAQPVSAEGYRLRVNTNCEAYDDSAGHEADTAEAKDVLNLTVTLHDLGLTLQNHIVAPAHPENVKVNLFDYWVEDYGKDPVSPQGDILQKSDSHRFELAGTWNISDSPTGYSNEKDWYKGINDGHLLLFGDGLIHAGLWNKGAGENTRYGKAYAGMEGIVKNTLTNGYPELNLANADKILNTDKDAADNDINSTYGLPKYKLIKDYNLAGDHNNEYGTAYNSDNIKNLSDTVIKKWGKSLSDGESLQYLFEPQNGAYKKSYLDVKGLFQLDEQGYYYYKMRENFAEFEGAEGENSGSNHFILYDAPATVRTDGERSIGNFLPFNKGYEVFNSVSGGNLTSSVECSRNTMNHHLGMTVEVDFRQPANGMINTGSNAQPMTFQFSGDDDVWVFIDDVLVLDMGGIHSEVYGIIDFASGNVLIGRGFNVKGIPAYDPNNPGNTADLVTRTNLKALYAAAGKDGDVKWSSNGSTFASNTSHTLKMFYLERGNYDSSLALRFNLQPMLYQQIKKVDQNGDPVSGVEFELYEAEDAAKGETGAIQCLYTDSTIHHKEEFFVKQKTGTSALVTLTTDSKGQAQFLQSDGVSYFNFADRGAQYYILRERNAPDGYRKQPIDIVLHYDPATAMLSVANRWTTGAYACSTVHVTGQPKPAGSAEAKGLVVAVPLMKKKASDNWLALYGSNLAGFRSVPRSSESDLLLAALYQAKSGAADWHLDWDSGNNRLTGTLSDLPGLASRYTLIDPEHGDMQMAYVLIKAEALGKLGITGKTTPAARYQALQDYFNDSTHTPETARDTMVGNFQRLATDTFNRDFRSLIYIPNERRELHVLKIDQDGKPLEGAEFGLYGDKDCTQPAVASGTTDSNGMLVFSPNENSSDGHAKMTWANSQPGTLYYLKETKAPTGHTLNPTVTPVVVGTYGIYADAGKAGNNVSVVADVGRLTQTMRQYAMGGNVDITLQDITAFMQTQESGSFDLNGWKDAKLDGTDVLRSMNLHFQNGREFEDYGLHDQDGGEGYYPFFVTNTGYIRARVEQNQDTSRYEARPSDTNKDSLGSTDLTNLFSLLNMVVVTDRNPASDPTGQLIISKKLTGSGLTDADYTKFFRFKLELKDKDGNPLSGSFDYCFYGKDKAGTVSSGDTLLLHHDESVTILGLPAGTTYAVTEGSESGWYVKPDSGTVTGTIAKDQAAEAAFTNSKDPNAPDPPIDPDPDNPEPDNPGPTPPSPPDDPKPTPTPPPDEPGPTPTPPPDDPGPTPTPPPDEPGPTPTPPPDEPYPTPTPPPPVFPPLYPTLPDPNDPDSPDEITIWENDIPITYVKVWNPETGEWVYVPEGEIPKISLTDDPPVDSVPPVDPVPPADPTVPPTGDISLAWYLVFGAALAGSIALLLRKPLKREE